MMANLLQIAPKPFSVRENGMLLPTAHVFSPSGTMHIKDMVRDTTFSSGFRPPSL